MDPRFKAKVQDAAVWARLEEEAFLRLQNQTQALHDNLNSISLSPACVISFGATLLSSAFFSVSTTKEVDPSDCAR